jgi:hypothetical protein
MGEKPDGDIAKAQDTLKRVRNMEEKYATLIQNQINEGGDLQLARNLVFTVPTAETLARITSRICHTWTKTAMKSGPLQLRTSWPQRSYWKITKAR